MTPGGGEPAPDPDTALFDPWGEAPEPAPPPAADRPDPPEPSKPVVLLRDALIPWLERLVVRLDAGGHRGAIQDLTDLDSAPSVRLLLWPKTGLLEEPVDDPVTLEVTVQADEEEPSIVVRRVGGPRVARLPPSRQEGEVLIAAMVTAVDGALGRG